MFRRGVKDGLVHLGMSMVGWFGNFFICSHTTVIFAFGPSEIIITGMSC